VRGTTRNPEHCTAIEGEGAEAVVADPDRVSTLIGALAHVSVAIVLLGSATGTPSELAALHGTRLDMLLSKLVDTTVHGLVYEAEGSVPAELLASGVRAVQAFGADTRARTAILRADPADVVGWLAEARETVERVLAPG